MRLYYTGAPEHLSTQGSPLSSLGGFISNTPISNSSLGSLFPDISQSEIFNTERRVILVALKNVSGEDKSNLRIFYEQENSDLYTIEMGVIKPAINNCVPEFEIVTKNTYLPIGVEFTDNKGLEEAIVVDLLKSDEYVGIWIKMEITDSSKDLFLSCDSLYELYKSGEEKNFPFSLSISY